MTAAGVTGTEENPGSKLKTAVTGKVKPGSKADKRRRALCKVNRTNEKISQSCKRSKFKIKTSKKKMEVLN